MTKQVVENGLLGLKLDGQHYFWGSGPIFRSHFRYFRGFLELQTDWPDPSRPIIPQYQSINSRLTLNELINILKQQIISICEQSIPWWAPIEAISYLQYRYRYRCVRLFPSICELQFGSDSKQTNKQKQRQIQAHIQRKQTNTSVW